MDAIKRASYASRQIKAGPAPLASFEDLPSDELESPEDISQVKIYTPSVFDDESGSRDLQFNTPDSLTISSQSTPHIESDFDSHFTLTPGEPYQTQSSNELRTSSLSSLSKEDSVLSIKQKKGSALSLGTIGAAESEYNQRKSSWTDIFKSHNQNSAKSSSSVLSQRDSSVPSEKTLKKSKSESYKKESTESKPKEKDKFLSLFKKKSKKNINSPSPPENFFHGEKLNISEQHRDLLEKGTVKLNNGVISKGKENEFISKGKENELPKETESRHIAKEAQNDLGKVNSEHRDKIPDERRLNRKLINISEKNINEKSFEKEYNILSRPVEEKVIANVPENKNVQDVVEESHESSESELTFELKETEPEKKDDDFEAENLLTHDLSEIDEDSVIELQPFVFEVPKQVIIPSRQQRLEITTKPIDRPRSTTPINVAPLEAFIQSVSPTMDSTISKIKLSLPGEQFTVRVKSPKKSSVKSWTDFCERGLHSPRLNKRIDKIDSRDPDPFNETDGANSLPDVPFSTSDQNWAAFESNFESSQPNIFSDNFIETVNCKSNGETHEQAPKRLVDPYQPFETSFNVLSCSCECHVYGCSNCVGASVFQKSEIQLDVDLESSTSTNSKSCTCKCHCKNDTVKSALLNDSFNCDVAKVFVSERYEKS
ncbi:uncharacterized protein LOC118195294 [Stegodyphus dumicola]|uniref:uncharacterized protein LOC118195294 n=1 Tax=Stegodyphus dumicola TaxID=202533 RepID=UPI0015B23A38|nr:uncharacterized protein LOC118195294 [Stegodyphus dumicola]